MAAVEVSLDPVGLVALVVAIVLGVGQLRLQRRMTALEEGRDRAEQQRQQQAQVIAQFRKKQEADPFFPSFWVTLKNTGAAPARDVTITIPDRDKHLRPGITVDPGALPVSWLHPGHHVDIQLDVIPGAVPPREVCVAWVDKESPQERRVTATWL